MALLHSEVIALHARLMAVTGLALWVGACTSPPPAEPTKAVSPEKIKPAATESQKRQAMQRVNNDSAEAIRSLKKLTAAQAWTREHLAVYLYDLNKQSVVWQHNASQAMRPASVMKLVTTISALELLGSQHRGRLELLISAADAAALQHQPPMAALYTLKQPLVLRGVGHSALERRDLFAVHEELTRLGVAAPTRVVLDRRWLPKVTAQAAFDENPLSRYNVVPDALMLEQNMQSYKLMSSTSTLQLRITGIDAPITAESSSLQFVDEPCAGAYLQRLTWQWSGDVTSPKLKVTGKFPKRCQDEGYAQLLPADWTWQASWRAFWPEAKLVKRSPNAPQDTLYVLSTLYDEPLSVRIRSINKYSDNAQARLLFASLSSSETTAPASSTDYGLTAAPTIVPADLNKSAALVTAFLQQQHIDTKALHLDNGSGLSRQETLSAAMLGQLLRWQWQQPSRYDFIASLPIGGVDGTLRKRFREQSGAQCAFLKTGTLNQTTALAGYLLRADRSPLVLVAIVNDEQAASLGVSQLNQLVNQLCQ